MTDYLQKLADLVRSAFAKPCRHRGGEVQMLCERGWIKLGSVWPLEGYAPETHELSARNHAFC